MPSRKRFQRFRSRRRRILSVIPSFAASLPLLLSAAEPPVFDEELFFTDVPTILTATRMEQPILETPAAVTVLDEYMIRTSGARDIAELFRLIPGFLVGNENGGFPFVTYHGLSGIFSPRLQVLIDGRSVYLAAFGGVSWNDLGISIEDIQKIEVIRGPNAAAYGANSFMAIVNISTYHAAETTGEFVSGRLGNKGIRDFYARHGGTTGDLDYRISIRQSADHGFDDRHDDKLVRSVNFRVDLRPSHRDTLMLSASYSSGEYQDGFTNEQTGDPPGTIQSRPFRDVFVRSSFQHVVWERMLDERRNLRMQLFHNYLDRNDSFLVSGFLPSVPIFISGQPYDYSYFSERYDAEVQFDQRLSETFRYVAGFNLREDRVRSARWMRDDSLQINRLIRGFLNVEYRHGKWFLNLGASLEDSDITDTEIQPRFALNYLLNDTESFRFIVSRATRNPVLYDNRGYLDRAVGIDPGPPVRVILEHYLFGSPNIEPEDLRSVEAGYHYRGGMILRDLDLKLFRDDFRKLIDDIGFKQDNDARAIVQGAELAAELRPAESWVINLGLTRMWSRYEVSKRARTEDSAYYRSIPDWIVTLNSSYRIGRTILTANYHWFDRMIWNGNADDDPFENVADLDVSISSRLRDHEHEWLEWRVGIQDMIPDQPVYYRFNLTSPRVYVELRYER